MFKIDVKMPKLNTDDLDVPFDCPECKKSHKVKMKDFKHKKKIKCSKCGAEINLTLK